MWLRYRNWHRLALNSGIKRIIHNRTYTFLRGNEGICWVNFRQDAYVILRGTESDPNGFELVEERYGMSFASDGDAGEAPDLTQIPDSSVGIPVVAVTVPDVVPLGPASPTSSVPSTAPQEARPTTRRVKTVLA